MIQALQALAPAVLPIAFYMLLQLPVAVIGTVVVRAMEMGWTAVLKSWIMGQILCYAVLQFMAVPMILMHWQFNVLFWSYLAVMAVAFGFGVWRFAKGKTRIRFGKLQLRPLSLLLLIVTVLLILWQSSTYFFGIHLDEDDARFVAQANDVLEYGQLLTRDWDTGEFLGHVDPARDITSPWSLMYAVSTRVLFTRASIFAHTVFPPVEILLVYGIYWLIGYELFRKTEARLTFTLTVAVVNLYFAGTVYTQSVFSLIRIWQGKATVAAVIVPLMLYLFISLNKHNVSWTWLGVIATALAACLMSGAGVMIALIMVGVYGFYHIIAYKTWKQILPWLGSLIPSAASLFIYLTFKG